MIDVVQNLIPFTVLASLALHWLRASSYLLTENYLFFSFQVIGLLAAHQYNPTLEQIYSSYGIFQANKRKEKDYCGRKQCQFQCIGINSPMSQEYYLQQGFRYASQAKQLQQSSRIISLGMDNDRFASPSSKYSTKGQKLVSKGRNLLKDLTKSKTPKSPSKNKAIPIFKPSQRRFVANVPKIEGFGNKNSIILTDQRVGQINRKYEIDSDTYKNFEYRAKLQKFYIDATYNPFTHQLTFQESAEKQKNVRQPLSERVNVISQMQKLRKQEVHIHALKNKMVNEEKVANHIHKKFKQNEIRNPTCFEQFQEIAFSSRESPLDKERQVGFLWLDEIVSVRQESFFQILNKQPKNIFALLKNKNHLDFQSNKQIMQKLHFNFDSVASIPKGKAKRTSINSLIQISTFSRQIMVNQKKSNDILFPSHLTLNISALQFTDMMYLASSRLNQYNLHEHLNENMQTKNEQQQEEIALNKRHKNVDQKENTVNRADNCVPETNDKTETNYYVMSHLIPIEKQQARISNNFKNKLKKLLQDEISSVNSGILDKNILETFRKAMELTLLGMLDANAQSELRRRQRSIDQKIRWNKVSKNRTENIKIHEVVDTVKLKKQYHKVTSKFASPSHNRSTYY